MASYLQNDESRTEIKNSKYELQHRHSKVVLYRNQPSQPQVVWVYTDEVSL